MSNMSNKSTQLNDLYDITYVDRDIVNGTNDEKIDPNYLPSKLSLIQDFFSNDENIKLLKENFEKILIHCCRNSRLSVLLYILRKNDEYCLNNDNNVINLCFEHSCITNNIEVTEWFMNSFTINQDIIKTICTKTCSKGHTNIVKYLCEKFGDAITDNLCENDNYVFKRVCKFNHITMAKWLCEKYPIYTIDIGLYKNPLTEYECDTILDYTINGKKFNVEEEKAMEDIDVDLQCMICHREHNLVLECKHLLCLHCFLKWYYKNENIKKCVLCSHVIVNNKVTYISN